MPDLALELFEKHKKPTEDVALELFKKHQKPGYTMQKLSDEEFMKGGELVGEMPEVTVTAPREKSAYDKALEVMKGMGETAEYAIGKVQKPVVETAKKMARPLGEPQPETLGEKVTGVVTGLPFEIAKRPAKWLQIFYHWEERSKEWEAMIKNPIGSKESKEAAKRYIEKEKWMRQKGLTPESVPIELALDLIWVTGLYAGMYNRAYAKSLFKQLYVTKKISPKELTEMVVRQQKKFLGNQVPTKENLGKATEQAWAHIDKTFKKYGIRFKEKLLGGAEIAYRKPIVTTLKPIFETAQNLIAPTITKGVVVKGVKPIVPTMPKFITGKNVWEIPKAVFKAQTRLAVKDLKTGKIYLGNKGEAIHSQILVRMDEMDIPYGSEIEAGFVSPDKSWIPRWKGMRRGPNEVEPIGIAEFEHADLHGYTIKKALDAGKTPYKGWEKDYPELAKKPTTGKRITINAIRATDDPSAEGLFWSDKYIPAYGSQRLSKQLTFNNPVVFNDQFDAVEKMFGAEAREQMVSAFNELGKITTDPMLALNNPKAVKFYAQYDKMILTEAKKRGYDGLIFTRQTNHSVEMVDLLRFDPTKEIEYKPSTASIKTAENIKRASKDWQFDPSENEYLYKDKVIVGYNPAEQNWVLLDAKTNALIDFSNEPYSLLITGQQWATGAKPPVEKDAAMELLEKHKKPELEMKAKEVKIEKPVPKVTQTTITGKPYILPKDVTGVEVERQKMEDAPLFESAGTKGAEQLRLGAQKKLDVEKEASKRVAKAMEDIGKINPFTGEVDKELTTEEIGGYAQSVTGKTETVKGKEKYYSPFDGEEISKEDYEFLTREGEDNLYQVIKREGGIRSYKEIGGKKDLREEYLEVPIHLRRNKGLALDEMADVLRRRYPQFAIESEADLITALANYRRGGGMEMGAGIDIYSGYESVKGFYSSKIGQPIYDRMSKLVPGFVKQIMTPYYGWNEYVKTLYREMLYDRIAMRADTEIARKNLDKLSNAERIAVYHLSTNQPLPHGIRVTPKAEEAARQVKETFNYLGNEAVKIGLMPEASFRKYFDKYLPRLYEMYERTKGDPRLFKKTLRLDLQRYMHRNESLSEEWREAAGEIKDVKELFSKGTIQHVHDITLSRFHGRLKNLPAEFTEGYKVVLSADEYKQATVHEILPYKYTRLPDIKKYGALRNSYIRDDVYKDLKGMFSSPGRWATINRIHKKLLTLWKLNKTVFSPATQARNFYFGIMQCDWGDGWDKDAIVKFVGAIRTKNDFYRELKRNAILGSGMVQREMTGYLEQFKNTDNKIEKVIDVFTDMLMNKLQGKRAARLYGASDDLFRSLIYTSQRLKGVPQAEARDYANFIMVNYREVSPFVDAMRHGPSPFITFYNGVAQSAVHTGIVKPWKFAKWYLLLMAIGARGLKESHELKWRKRKAMPGYLPSLTQELPALRLPWQNQNGEDLYLDMTYVIPFLDMQMEVIKATKGELKPLHPAAAGARAATRFINHPAFRLFADIGIHGKDAFLQEDLDTPAAMADYIYKQWMPNLAPEIPFTGIKGGWGWMGIKRAIQKVPSSGRGYIRSVPEAIGRYGLGIKSIPVNYIEELSSRMRYARFLMGESQAQIFRIAKDKSLKEKEKKEKTEEAKEEIRRLGDLIKDWADQKRWFEEHGINVPQKEPKKDEALGLLEKHKK